MKKSLIFCLAIFCVANVKASYSYVVENRSGAQVRVIIKLGESLGGRTEVIDIDGKDIDGNFTRVGPKIADNFKLTAQIGTVSKFPSDGSKQPTALSRDGKDLLVIVKQGGTNLAFERIDRE